MFWATTGNYVEDWQHGYPLGTTKTIRDIWETIDYATQTVVTGEEPRNDSDYVDRL